MIEAFPILNLDELSACKNGECSCCGRCCIALEVDVPAIHGDVFSAKFRKVMGQQCPQLLRGEDGKYLCAIHESKGNTDVLKVCKEFSGTDSRYEMLLDKIHEIVFNPQSPEDAALVMQWLAEGLLQDVNLTIESFGHLFCAIDNYLSLLAYVPHALYEKMGLHEVVSDMQRSQSGSLEIMVTQLNLERDNLEPHKQEFYDTYIKPKLSNKRILIEPA